jgi:hypothetical protein
MTTAAVYNKSNLEHEEIGSLFPAFSEQATELRWYTRRSLLSLAFKKPAVVTSTGRRETNPQQQKGILNMNVNE